MSRGSRPCWAAAISPQSSRSSGSIAGQVHRGEDLGFGPAGQTRFPPEDPVFVDLEAPLHPQVADRDVVGLGAGEVVQGRAVALLGHHPQVHLQAVAQHHRGFGVAFGDHPAHVLIRGEGVHHPEGLPAGDQDVQVAHRLHAAAVAAGHDGLRHPRHGLEVLDQSLGHGFHRHQLIALPGGR